MYVLILYYKQQQGIKVNETYVLNNVYTSLPMINKIWTPNPSGEWLGIVEIIEKLHMIENFKIENIHEKKHK